MDVGTMCSNINTNNNSNAKTTNVLDNLNYCKSFINLETDASIIACAMSHFGMQSLEDAPDEVIPPDVLSCRYRERQSQWFHKQIKDMVANYVMNAESNFLSRIVETVEAQEAKQNRALECRVCQKPYRYRKAMENHELKEHNYIHDSMVCT